jgi:3-hydroxyisobutyrate dehydrogenase-like beta-hydroxyacid dehydrogenase
MTRPVTGVVGLGSMGGGIARSLLRAGFETWGWDVSGDALASFIAAGGQRGDDAALGRVDVLVVVVVNAAQMEAVLFPGGSPLPLRPGALVLACPTVGPDAARAFEARLATAGFLYLDAPISGGSVKAAEGALTVMASGRPAAFAAAEPVLSAIAEITFRLGDGAGPGSAMKVVNQLLAGVHIAAAAEAITFAMTQGIEPAETLRVIPRCAGTSWMFENRGPHIVAGDYTPHSAVDIWTKDLGIVTATAAAAGFPATLAETALAQFRAAAEAGLGRLDDAAVASVYARAAGLTLPGED